MPFVQNLKPLEKRMTTLHKIIFQLDQLPQHRGNWSIMNYILKCCFQINQSHVMQCYYFCTTPSTSYKTWKIILPFKNKRPQVWNGAYAEVQTRGKFSAVWIQFDKNSNILIFTYSNCHS